MLFSEGRPLYEEFVNLAFLKELTDSWYGSSTCMFKYLSSNQNEGFSCNGKSHGQALEGCI